MRKNKHSPVVFAKKPTLVATQVALAVMAQLAYAQQAPIQTAERVERVEITGSRIPTVEAEGPRDARLADINRRGRRLRQVGQARPVGVGRRPLIWEEAFPALQAVRLPQLRDRRRQRPSLLQRERPPSCGRRTSRH